jgi:hypothetical protein
MMECTSVAADPFSILTVVVAPAVLTNASSVLALGTNNRLARVADRTHAVTAQLAKLEPGASDHELSTAVLAALQTRAQLLLQAASLLLLGSRTVRQFGSHLDRRFYRGVLRPAIGIPDSSWNWRRVWSISGHRAGLRLCPDDSRNAACSQRLSLRSKISHRLGFWPQGLGTVFGPEDVIEGRGFGAVFAQTAEALSPVVLAVHNHLGEALGDRGLCFEER